MPHFTKYGWVWCAKVFVIGGPPSWVRLNSFLAVLPVFVCVFLVGRHMAKFSFGNVTLRGLSCVVPHNEVSLLDDESLYGGDTKRINRVIHSSGFLKRRVADNDVMTSDLCLQAAETLITDMCIDRNEIDALLFISYTPDYLMPATSYVLHKRLGLSQDCIVMDIPQACSGFVLGLFQAAMLINSGCKNVLLLVGDSFSKFSDMFNSNTAPVFGDAGSASLISYDSNAPTSYFSIASDGNGYSSLMCENGGFRNPPRQENFYENGEFAYGACMQGGKIFDFTMSNIAPQILDLLEFSHIDCDSVDYFVFHQANKVIITELIRRLCLAPDKCPIGTMTKYGNQCGASIPCTIAEFLSEQVQNKSNKLLLSGFGVGLSWASAIIGTENIYCPSIFEYKR